MKKFNVKFKLIDKYSTTERSMEVETGSAFNAELLVLQKFKGVNKKQQLNGKVKIISSKEVKSKKG